MFGGNVLPLATVVALDCVPESVVVATTAEVPGLLTFPQSLAYCIVALLPTSVAALGQPSVLLTGLPLGLLV